MKTPLYRDALQSSFKLAWQHKGLWAFGLFAMFLGQLGVLELLSKVALASSSVRAGGLWSYLVFFLSPGTWGQFFSSEHLGADGWMWFVWMILIICGLLLALLFAAVVSQGAIVYSAAKYAKRESAFPDDAGAWHKGVGHFWRLLSLNLLRKFVFILMALAVVWSTVNALVEPSGFDIVLFFLIFILASVVGMVVSFLLVYAAAYIVAEEHSLGRALSAAWKLFLGHWVVSFEVGFLLILTNIVVLVLAMGALVYFFLLPVLLGTFLAQAFGSLVLFKAGVFVGYGLFLFFVMVLWSVFTVFVINVWTFLFVKMHRTGIKSRVLHWMRART